MGTVLGILFFTILGIVLSAFNDAADAGTSTRCAGLLGCLAVVLALSACDSSTEPDEPEKAWINVEGAFLAVEYNGDEVVPLKNPHESETGKCPEDSPAFYWIYRVSDRHEDPSVEDTYKSRHWPCTSTQYLRSEAEYRATEDSIFFGQAPPPGPNVAAYSGEWLDERRDRFRVVEDTAEVFVFERCSDAPDAEC